MPFTSNTEASAPWRECWQKSHLQWVTSLLKIHTSFLSEPIKHFFFSWLSLVISLLSLQQWAASILMPSLKEGLLKQAEISDVRATWESWRCGINSSQCDAHFFCSFKYSCQGNFHFGNQRFLSLQAWFSDLRSLHRGWQHCWIRSAGGDGGGWWCEGELRTQPAYL